MPNYRAKAIALSCWAFASPVSPTLSSASANLRLAETKKPIRPGTLVGFHICDGFS